ncbi:hypothetical protein CFAM422_006763 [Trichoderma lentiforme]|uniref:Tachykinin family protein n=1 Tax=Trichoderma lentiforme TaxID=1567552 RepID=A0A9P4XCY9_9HYPO|nr:hypothetical protein CFAM422_006763 [Trichoderma lentiforme]
MSGEKIYGASGFVHNNVVVNLPSRPHDERFTYTDEFDVQPLEFITITGSSTDRPDRNVSRIVRSQAMRNYVWRQNHPTLTDEMAAAAAVPMKEKPQRIFEGKFRVGSKSRKQKKPSKAKRPTIGLDKDRDEDSANEVQLMNTHWLIRQSLMPDKNLLMRGGAFADPYDSFQFPLGPESQKFIFYYQQVYAVNCIALNLSPDCFYYVREELAMFHAVMYLVSLDHNLKYGLTDSPGSLYHGREAFRLINEGLEAGVIRDTLIAAVSIVISRENLAGQFEDARIHMKGLELMVKARGGIEGVEPAHRGVVTWADLSYSNVWKCKPSFSQLTYKATNGDAELPAKLKNKVVSTEGTFGVASPTNSIFRSLRRISAALNPEYEAPLDRAAMSHQIYGTEFNLLNLQNEFTEALNPVEYLSSSSVLMNTAAYIYLYLILRELPTKSKLLLKLSQQLRDGLEMQDESWWNANPERQRWLLWVLFMGYGAASEWPEKWWFVEKMEPLGASLMVWTKDELESALKGIVWEKSCVDFLERLWKDISQRDRFELEIY